MKSARLYYAEDADEDLWSIAKIAEEFSVGKVRCQTYCTAGHGKMSMESFGVKKMVEVKDYTVMHSPSVFRALS